MKVDIINNPGQGVVDLLIRRVQCNELKERLKNNRINAVGLIQGQLIEIVRAADLAEKASNVTVVEIAGICPQHITMLGIFGDTAPVSEAVKAIVQSQFDLPAGHGQ